MKPLHLLLLLFVSIALVSADSTVNTVGKLPVTLSPEDEEKVKSNGQKFKFETEVNRMMKLIINTLYTTKEIFIRELVSNASDALDKIRFLALTSKDALGNTPDLKITIVADKKAKTLTITDTGIGMTREDLKMNLGTIAKSGTSEFLNSMESNKTADMSLIGQFGVGFYSAFLVADSVTVVSKNNNDKQYIWESTSENDFSIAEDPRGDTLGRGTQIIMHMKDNALEYLEEEKLKKLVRKYSEFINFPIYLWTSKKKTEEVPVEEDDDSLVPEENDEGVENVDDEKKPQTKTVTTVVEDWEQMNENKPIWVKSPSTVTDEEYREFYHAFTKDTQDPITWIHFKAEGEFDFRSIMYIPSKAPANFLQKVEDASKNFKLFVRKVFITDELVDFFPRYLNFIKGLLDSDDMPLNVSRETLQHSVILRLIKKKLIRKALNMIKDLSKDDDKYQPFTKEYGIAMKLGVVEDAANRKKLSKLIRFPSSNSEKFTSLDDYVSRMKKSQPQIYLCTGADLEEIKRSPFTEKLIGRGYEVLYMSDPIDEYVVQSLGTYAGKKLQNIAKAGLKYGDEDEQTTIDEEAQTAKFKPLVEYLQTTLSEFVEKVVVSNRLTNSPCAVVASEHGITGTMEKIMQAQALGGGQEDFMRNFYLKQKKIFEINPAHPIVQGLLEKVEKATDDNLKQTVHVLYETTLLRSGYQVPNTMDFAKRIERVIRDYLGVDLEKQAEVELKPAPELNEEEKKEQEEKKKQSEEEEAKEDDKDEKTEDVHDEL